MPFCPKCGTQANDWEQFCQQCSSPLPNRQPANPYGNQPQPPQQSQPPQPPQAPSYGAPEYGGYQQQQQSYGGYGSAATGNHASFGKRFLAYVLDQLVGLAGALPGIILLIIGIAIASSGEDEVGALFLILGYLLMFVGSVGVALYNIYLLGRDGASLGKRWAKIKVLDLQGQPLGFGKAFLRELVKGVVGGVCFILWFWPLWDQEQQGLHDKVFSTHVYDA